MSAQAVGEEVLEMTSLRRGSLLLSSDTDIDACSIYFACTIWDKILYDIYHSIKCSTVETEQETKQSRCKVHY